MNITVIGVNHQTAGVETRECVAVPTHILSECLTAALSYPLIAEALLLSTCNRCELYLVTQDGCDLHNSEQIYADILKVEFGLIKDHCYVLRGNDAVAHMFKVAAGADSMVLGETEIMGQLREAIACGRETGATGRILSRLGDRALAVGKRARTETRIDKGCMSVASVASDLACQIFDNLSTRRLLVLGAGEMGALVARRMIDNGAKNIVIISRTIERAEVLASEIGGEAVDFEYFVDELMKADIVITSTSSPHPLVTVDRVKAAAGEGRRRPMLLVDLAMPRDVDPQVREIDDVYLYDLDDLQEFVRDNVDQRLCELPAVETIAEDEARDFMIWATSQEVVPLVLNIRQQAEAIRDEEITHLLEAIPDLPRKADKAIYLMTKRLVRRILDQPLEKIRELSADGVSERDLQIIRELFGCEACTIEQTSPDAKEDDNQDA